MPAFYDTHAHLDDPRFADDLTAVVARAYDAGIARILCVGTDFLTSRRAIEIAEAFPGVYAAVGWHPTHVLEAPEDVRPGLRELAHHPKVVAIGETGLDYFHPPESRAGGAGVTWDAYKLLQSRTFQQQLEIAAERGLPVVVHHRKALDDCLRFLAPWADRVRGQFHCFEDDAAAAARVLASGAVVSFTGLLTHKNKPFVREALATVPLGQFMLETDSPYLVPDPLRRTVKRCEPAFVRETAAVAAEVKGCSLDELSAMTCRTADAFFRW